MSPTLSVPETMLTLWQDALDNLTDFLTADVARIVRIQQGQAEIILTRGRAAESYSKGELAGGNTRAYFQDVIHRQSPVQITDASLLPEWKGSSDLALGFSSYRGIPITSPDGTLYGVIDVLHSTPRHNSELDERMLAQAGRIVEDQLALHAVRDQSSRLEADIHAHRERAMLAADVIGMGVWDYNIDADILVCDPVCYRIYGLDPAKVELRTIGDFKACVHPDDVDRITDERMAALASSKQDRHIDFRLLTPAGETRWITSAACMLHATAVTPNRLVGVVIDITESRLAKEKLQSSFETLNQAEKLARIGSWKLDLSTGTFITSDMLFEMNGANPSGPPLTPEDLQRMLAPESFMRVSDAIAQCVATGESYGLDVTHYRKDGTPFAAHIRGQAQRDSHDKIVALSGTVQDISEREEARARLEALADNLPNGAIYRLEHVDDDYRLTYVSGGVEALFGISAARMTKDPRALRNAIHEDDLSRYLATAAASHLAGTDFDCEFRTYKPDGSVAWMRCRAVPRHTETGTVWDGIMLDITREHEISQELKRAKEAAEAAERAKSDFLATMSHEIRTPMNTVIGMTWLVQQTNLSPKQRNYLDKIDISAKALLSIINDILDFSKIGAGMLTLEDTEFALEDVLKNVSAVTAMRAEEKNLEIAYAVAHDVPRYLRGDPLRLGQILTNLVSNAVKFTDAGEIVVRVACAANNKPQLHGQQILEFSVSDTGIGIDDTQIKILFQPFSQASPQISAQYGGTGLGLVICRQLVEMMDGEISVVSQPGHGSTFRFTIVAKPVEPAAAPMSTLVISSTLTGRRLLIIDDNASAREILGDMVRGFGMRADTARSGVEGLRVIRQASEQGDPYAIVLMDWQMPHMDGLEVARRIREEESLPCPPMVVMVTAYGRDEVLQRIDQLGLRGLLIKPVTESVMFDTLLQVLQQPGPAENYNLPPAMSGINEVNLIQDEILTGRRVLVVDDNALNREVATDFLELVGINVITAANGIEALERLKAESFDAVLMDMHMPGMDGMTATREIRRDIRWADLPIIALTAQAQVQDRAASLEAGMNAHVTKPIDEKELYGTLREVLRPGWMDGKEA